VHDWPWYASWPRGLSISLDYPPVPVYKLLESSAAKWPTREAIVFQIGEGVTTYAELWEKAQRFATALARLGVRKGDVVALQLPNSPPFAVAYYGSLLVGASVSPCSPLLSARELEHQLKDSGAQTLVALDMFMETVMAVRGKTRVKQVVVTGIQELLPSGDPVDVKAYGPRTYSLLKLLLDTPPTPPQVKIDPDRDTAHLAYTGGTTGLSKGVILTHKAVVANTLQLAHWVMGGRPLLRDGLLHIVGNPTPGPDEPWEFPVTPEGGKVLTVVPWFHAMGITGYLNLPIYVGATMVVHPRFDAAAYAADIARHQASAFGGAPALFHAMLAVPGLGEKDYSAVRLVTSGAAPLPVELLDRMSELLPNAVIMEAYGLTEMAMAATANPANRSGKRKPGSVGIPVFDTDVKIVDLDDPDLEIGYDELGEICLRGPQMMKGYLNRREETAAVLRKGWIHTGDIGRLDEEGYLYIVDRKKDMLIYKGHNVYPRELEEIIFTHPAVANCAVIGKPDPAAGEIPKAFVVLKPGASATAEEIMNLVSSRVGAYKKIREVEFIPAIPVSLAGKPLKRDLRAMEQERLRAAAEEGGGEVAATGDEEII
jgi:long-chain acyl-CoA synthetase